MPLNESWGVDDIEAREEEANFALSLYHLTKAVDPGRPVVSNDGWEHVKSDIWTIHEMCIRDRAKAASCRGRCSRSLTSGEFGIPQPSRCDWVITGAKRVPWSPSTVAEDAAETAVLGWVGETLVPGAALAGHMAQLAASPAGLRLGLLPVPDETAAGAGMARAKAIRCLLYTSRCV